MITQVTIYSNFISLPSNPFLTQKQIHKRKTPPHPTARTLYPQHNVYTCGHTTHQSAQCLYIYMYQQQMFRHQTSSVHLHHTLLSTASVFKITWSHSMYISPTCPQLEVLYLPQAFYQPWNQPSSCPALPPGWQSFLSSEERHHIGYTGC